MAVVYGKIESLERIKDTLNKAGIDRFNSVADINAFNQNYSAEKESIVAQVEKDVDIDILTYEAEVQGIEKQVEDLQIQAQARLTHRLEDLQFKIDEIRTKNIKYSAFKAFYWLWSMILKFKRWRLKRNYNSMIRKELAPIRKELTLAQKKLENTTLNKNSIVEMRSRLQLKKLEKIKELTDELNPLIAGAIGENRVQKELQILPDNHVVFNDFSVKFKPPIYNKENRDRILSIQIDHLLVNNAGIFIIETKNWSKASVENRDLRSPVKQIKRSSYALYTALNSSKHRKFKLSTHWGDKEISVRNVIAMINHKPLGKFKFVDIKTLNELNGYIRYFEPVFTDKEVNTLVRHLKKLNRNKSLRSSNDMKNFNSKRNSPVNS